MDVKVIRAALLTPAAAALFSIGLSSASAQPISLSGDCLPLSTAATEDSFARHLYGGSPDGTDPLARRGYVLAYDEANQVAAWAAWHADPTYRIGPPRKGVWKTYRSDPTIEAAPSKADYNGWSAQLDIERGHMVPFFIGGGDRDGDGRFGVHLGTENIDDVDDACTVYEINMISNIAPQFGDTFNGATGIWFALETDVRVLVDEGRDFQIIAGTVFASEPITRIGPMDDQTIGIPHGYFKIVIDPDTLSAVGFLFDHDTDLADGCDINVVIFPSQCIVTIEEIEAATGLTFFPELTAAQNQFLRDSSASETWLRWLGIID